jgi:hypothetical protein
MASNAYVAMGSLLLVASISRVAYGEDARRPASRKVPVSLSVQGIQPRDEPLALYLASESLLDGWSISVNDGPATSLSGNDRQLCTAPCTAYVRPGTKLQVAAGAAWGWEGTAIRSAPFRAREGGMAVSARPGSTLGDAMGWTVFFMGMTSMLIGGLYLAVESEETRWMRYSGAALLGGGAVVSGFGFYLTHIGVTHVHDENGRRVAGAGVTGAF